MICGFYFCYIGMAIMECTRCHHHHRHIDKASNGECDDALPVRKSNQLGAVEVVVNNGAGLSQTGMQVDRMRHDSGTDNTDSDRHGARIVELRHDRMEPCQSPIDWRNE